MAEICLIPAIKYIGYMRRNDEGSYKSFAKKCRALMFYDLANNHSTYHSRRDKTTGNRLQHRQLQTQCLWNQSMKPAWGYLNRLFGDTSNPFYHDMYEALHRTFHLGEDRRALMILLSSIYMEETPTPLFKDELSRFLTRRDKRQVAIGQWYSLRLRGIYDTNDYVSFMSITRNDLNGTLERQDDDSITIGIPYKPTAGYGINSDGLDIISAFLPELEVESRYLSIYQFIDIGYLILNLLGDRAYVQ